jgi:hypothetical protein
MVSALVKESKSLFGLKSDEKVLEPEKDNTLTPYFSAERKSIKQKRV